MEVRSTDRGIPLGDRSNPGGSSSAHAVTREVEVLETPNDSADGDAAWAESPLLDWRGRELQVHCLAAAAGDGGCTDAVQEDDHCHKPEREGEGAAPDDGHGSDAHDVVRTSLRGRKLPRNSKR